MPPLPFDCELASSFELRPAWPSELSALLCLDDAAGILYQNVGMAFSFASDHPFVVDEGRRWSAAIERGESRVILSGGVHAAFAIFGEVDGAPYLDQLSVHPDFMRRGLGQLLLAECVRFAEGRDVWLTTYAHLPWNAAYYGKFGFRLVPEESCGPGLRQLLRAQRAALPEPEQRVAMVRLASAGGT